MDINGPAFVKVHNGKIFNKYEVTATEKSLAGISTICYYFDTKDDAELYYKFLLQTEGEKLINTIINSPRTYDCDKEDYIAFKNSIDFSTLTSKVKNIKFIKEEHFVKVRIKNVRQIDSDID